MVEYMEINEEKIQDFREVKRILILSIYDDLCRRIDPDDVLIISNENDDQEAAVRIIGLYRFQSFKELYANIPAEILDEERSKVTSRIKDGIKKNYSEMVDARFGVIGILAEPFDCIFRVN